MGLQHLESQPQAPKGRVTPNGGDLRLALDVAAGWLIARLVWLAAQELVIKPVMFRLYEKIDTLLGDRLPPIR